MAGAFLCLPQKTIWVVSSAPKRVCGTFGRSVNIDFRIIRIFVRLEALVKN